MSLVQSISSLVARVAQELNLVWATLDALAVSSGGPQVGTAFPSNPVAGQSFIRSDLGFTEFVWDTSRSRWMSVWRRSFVYNANNDDDILRIGNTSLNNLPRDGFPIPYDIVLTGWISKTRFNDSGSLQIFNTGVTIAAQSWASVNVFDSGEIDVFVPAGAKLSMQIVNSTSGAWTRFVSNVEYARTAS